MLRVALLSVFLALLSACGTTPMKSTGSTGPSWKRTTSFEPRANVTGSRLVTDRVLRIDEDHTEKVEALGGTKLGVLKVKVIVGIPTTNASEFDESDVWPGASVDAAALGATHARRLSVQQLPPRRPGKQAYMTDTVTAEYELWHVDPDRWGELPKSLRPKMLPLSEIRDVQPGNWVRPPTVVEIKK